MHLSQRRAANDVIRMLAALLVILATGLTCCAQTTLSPDARRDTELRPGVVSVRVFVTGIFHPPNMRRGVQCEAGVGGTGFLYRPDGYLITNGHVAQLARTNDEEALEEQRDVLFEQCVMDPLQQAIGRRLTEREAEAFASFIHVTGSVIVVVLSNNASYTGEIKAYSGPITSPGGKDVAIIKIDANNLPTVPLGDSDAVNVNDHVYTIGYPGAAKISKSSELVATSSDGIISAIKTKDYSGTPVLQTTANINHGNSGGPAFNAAGEVIGITTFGKQEAGYNFLVPISTAKEFIRTAGAEPARGNFDTVWHQSLDAYANQDWDSAHQLLGEVLEMMPNLPDAQRLQIQAAAGMRNESPFQVAKHKLGMPGLVILALIVVLIVGLLIWLMVRRSPQPAPVEVQKASVNIAEAPPVAVSAAVMGATRIDSPPRLGTSAAAEKTYGSLIVSGGPLTGNRFQVTKAGLTIGRDPSKNNVVLSDDSVSKEHAWVVPVDNGVAIIDRNSANGTYINSVDSPRINKVVLRHGDRVYLGKQNQTVFTYYSS